MEDLGRKIIETTARLQRILEDRRRNPPFDDAPETRTAQYLARPLECPSVKIEQKYGFTGLSRQYVMPDGLQAEDIERYIVCLNYGHHRGDVTDEDLLARVQEIARPLRALNPDLAAIACTPENAKALVTGATSHFLPRDIEHFISMAHVGDNDYKKCRDRLERKIDRLEWNPAPDTLRHIEHQLEEKTNTPGYTLPRRTKGRTLGLSDRFLLAAERIAKMTRAPFSPRPRQPGGG